MRARTPFAAISLRTFRKPQVSTTASLLRHFSPLPLRKYRSQARAAAAAISLKADSKNPTRHQRRHSYGTLHLTVQGTRPNACGAISLRTFRKPQVSATASLLRHFSPLPLRKYRSQARAAAAAISLKADSKNPTRHQRRHSYGTLHLTVQGTRPNACGCAACSRAPTFCKPWAFATGRLFGHSAPLCYGSTAHNRLRRAWRPAVPPPTHINKKHTAVNRTAVYLFIYNYTGLFLSRCFLDCLDNFLGSFFRL